MDALPGQATEVDFSHVEPTSTFKRAVKFKTLDQSSGLKGEIGSNRHMGLRLSKAPR
jgi:hypothetical protein